MKENLSYSLLKERKKEKHERKRVERGNKIKRREIRRNGHACFRAGHSSISWRRRRERQGREREKEIAFFERISVLLGVQRLAYVRV